MKYLPILFCLFVTVSLSQDELTIYSSKHGHYVYNLMVANNEVSYSQSDTTGAGESWWYTGKYEQVENNITGELYNLHSKDETDPKKITIEFVGDSAIITFKGKTNIVYDLFAAED